jgi:hypothetical protein
VRHQCGSASLYDREPVDAELRQDRALVDEVERFASAERDRLSSQGIELRYRRSQDHWDKTSGHLGLERLPWAAAELSVWDTGEADLGAAWGQRDEGWDELLMEHLELGSIQEVRDTLTRVVRLVNVDHQPEPGDNSAR